MTKDRNLLFGVFAVLLRTISPSQLAEVAGEWLENESEDISLRLENAGLIDAGQRAFIRALVDEAVRANDGNISAAFDMVGGPDQVFRAFAGRISCSFGPRGLDVAHHAFREVLDYEVASGITETPGRYSLRSEYARGGMGRVLLVHDEHMGRDVALKELLPDTMLTDIETTMSAPVRRSLPMVARFLQEAKVTAQLEHPAIVPVYELGHRMDGTVYYTMKLVRGKTLAQAIHDAADLRGRLALLPHFVDLCNAIAYAHSRGVIHRDIKPGNVMVGEFGETVVLDWGLAKTRDHEDIHGSGFQEALHAIDVGDEAQYTQTQYGHALGTPNYMPPEQAAGRLDAIDERADVYSLGAVLYELLTGRPPYKGSNAKSVIMHVLHDRPLPVQVLETDAPPELTAIATKSLERLPEKRFQTVRALADDIRRFQSGALVSAHRYALRDYTRFIWRRYKLPIAAGTMVVVLALAFAATYTWSVVQAGKRERALRLETEQANVSLRWENYAFALGVAQNHMARRDYPAALPILAACPEEFRDWEWGFLARQCDPSILRIMDSDFEQPPYGNPGGCVLSDDGRYLLMHRYFSSLKHIIDLSTGAITYRQTVGDVFGWMRCTRFAPDGQSFTASLDNHRVGRWNCHAEGEEPNVTYDAGDAQLRSLVFNDDASLAVGYAIVPDTGEAKLFVWDGPTGARISRYAFPPIPGELYLWPGELEWAHMKQPIRGQVLGFMPDNQTVIVADTHLATVDTRTGTRHEIVPAAFRVAYCPEVGIVAAEVPSGDHINVIRLEDTNVLCSIPLNPGDMSDITIRPDGKLLVLAGATLQAFDIPTGSLLYETPHRVESGSFSANGALYLCLEAGTDYTQAEFLDAFNPADHVFRWPRDADHNSLSTAMNLESTGTPQGTPTYRYSRDGQWLFTGDSDGTARRWLAGELVLDRTWKVDEERITEIDATADGSRALTASERGVVLWNVVTGEPITEILPREGERPVGCALSPDGTHIAYAAQFGRLNADGENLARVYRADTGELEYTVSGHPGNSNLIAFSPDGNFLFTGGYGAPSVSSEPSVFVWDAATGTKLMGTIDAINWPWRIEFSPDGTQALVMSLSLTAVMYDIPTQTERYRVRVNDARQAVFLPGGTRFALGTVFGFTVHAVSDGRQLIRWDGGGYPLLRAATPDALLSAHNQTLYTEWRTKPWAPRTRTEEFADGLTIVQERLGITPQ